MKKFGELVGIIAKKKKNIPTLPQFSDYVICYDFHVYCILNVSVICIVLNVSDICMVLNVSHICIYKVLNVSYICKATVFSNHSIFHSDIALVLKY